MLNPFRLPVHPSVVHFPVALLSLVWGMLVLRYLTGNARWDERARFLHAIGILSIPVALATALIDTRGLEFITSPRWDAPLVWHALGGLALAGVAVGHFAWRRRYAPGEMTGRLAVTDLTLASVAFWGIVLVGLLAGEMVYAT